MAPHPSTLAWKSPWTEEPGGLQSMGSLRVRHDLVASLSLFSFMHWRGKWQPTPVFLPGESQGRGNLVGFCLWGRTESDTTEMTQQQQQCKLDTLVIAHIILNFILQHINRINRFMSMITLMILFMDSMLHKDREHIWLFHHNLNFAIKIYIQ